jgi:maltose 6'-phosphate phosphatase
MRFATYNIWNSATLQQERQLSLVTALVELGADVVALQEVPTAFGTRTQDAGAFLAGQSTYPYSYFRAYPTDPDEGLAILSRHPLYNVGAEWDEPHPTLPGCAIGATVKIAGYQFSFVSLHLHWSSIAIREQQITRVITWHNSRKVEGDVSLLCGDFNAIPESSVYCFLQGQQSLHGVATQPWVDLAVYDAHVKCKSPSATLNKMTNPRWAKTRTLDLPLRLDWLLLDVEMEQIPPRVQGVDLFGVSPLAPSNTVPSDHYGVYADLSFT